MASTRAAHRRDQIRRYDRSTSVVFLKTKEAFGGLSNMAGGFPLLVNGVRIRTSEALYQACRFPHLPDVQRSIIAQRSPMTAKMKGKPYRRDSRRDWNGVRVNVMRWCLRVKLAQNWDLFSKLLRDTGDRAIVEQSGKDDFWGAKPVDHRTLVGMNVLGRLLMELREAVKTEPQESFRRVEPLHMTDFLLGGCPIEPVTDRSYEQDGPDEGSRTRFRRYGEPEASDAPLPLAAPRTAARPIREAPTEYTVMRGGCNLKPYPVYKDSGVRWLGDLPEHWEVRRLRNTVTMRVSNVDKHVREGEIPVRLCNYVDVYKHERISSLIEFMRATATADEIAQFQLEKGDVLITKDSEAWDDIGVPAVVTEPAKDLISGYHLALLRPRGKVLVGHYLVRALQSRAVAYQFHVRAKGVTRYGLSHAGIKSVWIGLPPRSEQAAIARFIDHADRRIRRYIRAKQKLIGLLAEQKQAIIHQAATGQIDVRTGRPYPAYKSSGVEWLGDVPAHWDIRRLRNVGEAIIGLTYHPRDVVGRQEGVLVLRASNVVGGQIVSADDVFVNCLVPYRLVTRMGDILLCSRSGSRALIGKNAKIGVASAGVTFGAFMTVFRSKNSDFLHHVFNSKLFEHQSGAFLTSTINQLTLTILCNIRVPWPPEVEQQEVVNYLGGVTAEYDAAVGCAKREVDLLPEYRARLIADVVTGKLDVREAAAGLPEVDPLPAEDDLIDGADHDTGSERTRWRNGEAEGRAVADVPVAERRGRGQRVG